MAESNPLPFARAPGKPRCRYGDVFCTTCSIEHWRSFDHHEDHQFLQPVTAAHSGTETLSETETEVEEVTQEEDAAAAAFSAAPASSVNLGSDTDGEKPEAVSGRTLASIVEEIACLGTFRGVGLIVGPTGSGKTCLLAALVKRGIVKPAAEKQVWPERASVVSALAERCGGVQAAMSRLNAVGLNTVPEWVKPFSALSNGQQARVPHRGGHCATDQRAKHAHVSQHPGRSGARSPSHSSRACSATTSAASLSRA